MLLEKQREKIIQIALEVQKLNLVALTFGNFSIRDIETGYVCVTPSGMKYEDLKTEDIVIMDTDCNIVDGSRKPSIEASMHCAVYRKRKDVFGIVHTHSVYATAWASCNKSIPCVLAETAAVVGGTIKCAPFKPMGSVELAEVTIEELGNSDAVLMERHGVLAVGNNIDVALANAIIVEESAKVAYFAKNIGEISELPKDVCLKLRNDVMEKYGQK
ncbi:class II aldolase/adducin family protein [Clostridium oceanicum]|uniref:Class II aldolase/adducin family protein n=1 Tax=Clostridium oceanicum TaxID=1543 RepID=A0ABP3UE72_9CLOT